MFSNHQYNSQNNELFPRFVVPYLFPLFPHFLKMSIQEKLYSIANEAGTTYLVPLCQEYISKNTKEFIKEGKQELKKYTESLEKHERSKKIRFSVKKFEKGLHSHLSLIVNKSTRADWMQVLSEIMIQCGYISYKINPNRFRQMIENRKKKLKKGAVNKNPDNQSVNQSINEKPVNQSADKPAEVIPEFEDHEDNSKNAEENSTMEEETEDNQEEEEYKENQLTQVDTSDQNSNILDVNYSDSDNINNTGGYDNERDMIVREYFPNSVTSPQANNQMIALPLFVPNDWDLYSIPTYSNNPQDFDNLPEYSNDNPLDDFDNLHFQFPFLR